MSNLIHSMRLQNTVEKTSLMPTLGLTENPISAVLSVRIISAFVTTEFVNQDSIVFCVASREDISEQAVGGVSRVPLADCWLFFVLNGVKKFFTFSTESRCFLPFPWFVRADRPLEDSSIEL